MDTQNTPQETQQASTFELTMQMVEQAGKAARERRDARNHTYLVEANRRARDNWWKQQTNGG